MIVGGTGAALLGGFDLDPSDRSVDGHVLDRGLAGGGVGVEVDPASAHWRSGLSHRELSGRPRLRAQLEALRAREHGALVELAELCELLRTQHLLSRFGGSERAGELRDELWARVRALSELEM